jgi:hypothetical protein
MRAFTLAPLEVLGLDEVDTGVSPLFGERVCSRSADLRHSFQVSSRRRRTLIILVVLLVEPVAMWLRGYPIGGKLVVRCRQGHLFRTLWIPGVSVKALRLLWWRFQRCPVGGHWSVVAPVKESDLTARERRLAGRQRDTWIP